jgi:O-acetyl-ADP-ribose deacetylase (regulator of RNase III)
VKVRVAQGSLTDGDETLLVNASNTNVALGAGVSAAIRAACGPGYQEHIAQALRETYGGPMEPGQVLLTDAGAHPRARWVAHVAVMDYREGFRASSFPTLEVIRTCCTNLVAGIDALPEPVTVAMVALGAGTGQLGVRDPTRIACEAFAAYAKERGAASNVAGVTFYGYSLVEYAAMADVVCGVFPEVEATIPADVRASFTKG